MDKLDALIEIERCLAAGGGEEYRTYLAADAVVILPNTALDKPATVAAMEGSDGWDSIVIEDAHLLDTGDGVGGITYRFLGKRGEDFTYEALMTSLYADRGDGWELLLHQQTPCEAS